MLALCQQIEVNLIQGHQNLFLLVLKRGGTKGYILLNIQLREIFVSKDVVFYEHVFLYQKVEDISNETDSPNIHDQNEYQNKKTT